MKCVADVTGFTPIRKRMYNFNNYNDVKDPLFNDFIIPDPGLCTG